MTHSCETLTPHAERAVIRRRQVLRHRVARWGMLRLLRFCWFHAAHGGALAARALGLPGRDVDVIRGLETVAPMVLSMAGLRARGELRVLIVSVARQWFAGLQTRLVHLPAHERRGELAWLLWANRQEAGQSPLERLMASVIRHMSALPRDPRRAAGSLANESEQARRQREERRAQAAHRRRTDYLWRDKQERLQGRRELVSQLATRLATAIRDHAVAKPETSPDDTASPGEPQATTPTEQASPIRTNIPPVANNARPVAG